MGSWLDTLQMLVRIALRNLVASRLKTIIVGGIIFGGALLVVVGTSFLDSIDESMSRSITGSVAGHAQVYSSASKDELTVMGGFDLEGPDIAPFEDFAPVRKTLLDVPNVKSVVPMGISGAMVTSGNTIDVALAKLRDLVRKRLAGDRSSETAAAYDAEKGHIRQIVRVLEGDIANIRVLQEDSALPEEDARAVKRVATDTFWSDFDKDPLAGLEFMENRIATLAADADMLFLRYVGTDPQEFARSFDRMRIIDGQAIPRGKRGFLFAKYIYEEQVKLKTAYRLDKIKRIKKERNASIATDPELQRFVKENSTQVKEVLLQLDEPKTKLFRAKLQKELGSAEVDVAKLLGAFLATDDANFRDRYDFFYRELAPSLDLYRVRIGDPITIKAFTRGGYVQSVNLRVYGTFEFQGLEGSPQAGALNMMDLVSFRELYGFLSPERRAELMAMKAASGSREVSRDRAEADLFGARPADDAGEKNAGATPTAESALEALSSGSKREDRMDKPYDPAELESGVALNAAVIMRDARPRALRATLAAIDAAGPKANLPLKAISWQAASGIIGQFVTMMRAVLYVAVLIIFVVALVIINNAMVMATLERQRELGTLRAIGAQRRFILGMLLVEALVVGLLFGGLGTAIGALIVVSVGRVGIPAFNDIATFFFSGPRFHPWLGTSNLVIALVIVLLVSLLSSFYPAWLAMRVTPRQAMQTEE